MDRKWRGPSKRHSMDLTERDDRDLQDKTITSGLTSPTFKRIKGRKCPDGDGGKPLTELTLNAKRSAQVTCIECSKKDHTIQDMNNEYKNIELQLKQQLLQTREIETQLLRANTKVLAERSDVRALQELIGHLQEDNDKVYELNRKQRKDNVTLLVEKIYVNEKYIKETGCLQKELDEQTDTLDQQHELLLQMKNTIQEQKENIDAKDKTIQRLTNKSPETIYLINEQKETIEDRTIKRLTEKSCNTIDMMTQQKETIESKDKTIQNLTEKSHETIDMLTQQKETINDTSGTIQMLTEKSCEASDMIIQQKQTIDAKDKTMQMLTEKRHETVDMITQQKGTIKDKDGTIQMLTEKSNETSNMITQLNKTIQVKDNAIQRLTGKSCETIDMITQQKDTIKDKDRAIEILTEKNLETNNTITQQKELIENKAKTIQRLIDKSIETKDTVMQQQKIIEDKDRTIQMLINKTHEIKQSRNHLEYRKVTIIGDSNTLKIQRNIIAEESYQTTFLNAYSLQGLVDLTMQPLKALTEAELVVIDVGINNIMTNEGATSMCGLLTQASNNIKACGRAKITVVIPATIRQSARQEFQRLLLVKYLKRKTCFKTITLLNDNSSSKIPMDEATIQQATIILTNHIIDMLKSPPCETTVLQLNASVASLGSQHGRSSIANPMPLDNKERVETRTHEVDEKLMSHVIGADGRNITRLLREYKKVKIAIKENGLLTLTGQKDTINEVIDDIERTLRPHRTSGFSTANGEENKLETRTHSVDESLMRHVIGTDGHNIKRLTSEYKVKLVAREDGTITLTGEHDAINGAICDIEKTVGPHINSMLKSLNGIADTIVSHEKGKQALVVSHTQSPTSVILPQDEVEHRLETRMYELDEAMLPHIIGTEGRNIKKLLSKHNVTIKHTTYGILTLIGEKVGISGAIADMEKTVQQMKNFMAKGSYEEADIIPEVTGSETLLDLQHIPQENKKSRLQTKMHKVDEKLMGLVVGKDGQNIKRLRCEYKVRIEPIEDRCIQLTGKQDTISEVIEDIESTVALQKVQENGVEIRKHKVDESLMGLVVGKDGRNIKRLSHKYNVQIGSIENGLLELMGKPDKINELIYDIECTVTPRRVSSDNGVEIRTHKIDDSLLKHVIGIEGRNIKRLLREYKVKIDTQNHGLLTITGEHNEINGVIDDIEQTVKQQQVEIRTHNVEASLMGHVIGTDGRNLKRLRCEYNVKITSTPDGLITVTGHQKDITSVIDDIESKLGPHRHLMFNSLNEKNIETKTYSVDESSMGRVIGKGKRNIKRLQLKYSVDISYTEEGLITLTGESKNIGNVIHDIETTVKLTKVETRTHRVAESLMGVVIGKAGRNIKRLMHEYNVEINHDEEDLITFIGIPEGITAAIDDIEKALQQLNTVKTKNHGKRSGKRCSGEIRSKQIPKEAIGRCRNEEQINEDGTYNLSNEVQRYDPISPDFSPISPYNYSPISPYTLTSPTYRPTSPTGTPATPGCSTTSSIYTPTILTYGPATPSYEPSQEEGACVKRRKCNDD